MGYDGLVMTDDLDMGAVAKHYDILTCIRQILMADADIILICRQSPKVGIAYDEVLRHIGDSQEMRTKAILSYRRIFGMKNRFGLIV
jgi:beta-N-acetylhexosaminidase